MKVIRYGWPLAGACALALVLPPASGRLEGAPGQARTIGRDLIVRQVSPRTGRAVFASADGDGLLLGVPAALPAESRALGFIGLHGHEFGIDRADLALQRAPAIDPLGIEHVRFRQTHRGVPVTGGEFVVHLRGARVVAANGRVLEELPDDVMPAIAAADAVAHARQVVGRSRADRAAGARYAPPRLEIFNRGMIGGAAGPTRLAWFVEATGPALREYIWIDAEIGVHLLSFSQLPEAKQRQTYDAAGGAALPGTLLRSEGQGLIGDADVDSAHDFAGDAYDYFLATHGRDSFDGAGGSVVSSVRYCPAQGPCPYPNAFWLGGGTNLLVYGQGYAQADDIVAHEFAHGVTEATANLFYYYQSGALNESLSDIFGETVDLLNGAGTDGASERWVVGEDLPGGQALRHMMTPTLLGSPGKVSDPEFFCHDRGWSDAFADRGGVHVNSGVPNHAYALMVDGGTYNGRVVTGIGVDRAARIWYRALTTYLTSGSGFLDAYHAVQQSCVDLIGTAGITASSCTQAMLAVDAVELSETWNCAAANAAPPLCPSGAAPDVVFGDDFENDITDWVVTSTSTTHWGTANWFANGGDISLFGPNLDRLSDHRVQMTVPVMVPASARLYFDQAFEFETFGSNHFDGGVLEYSIDNGISWHDVVSGAAGNLIDAGQTYNGTISDTAPPEGPNPLANRQAFVRQSFGYTGTRLNLAPLAGQAVQFRFRVGTDNIIGSLGWFIDNFQLYTCDGAASGELLGNGSFVGGSSNWQVFGLPTTPTGIVWQVAGGRFTYYRPPGSEQGVVLQSTGTAVPANTAVAAEWQMGNADTGSVRKRFSVLIGDSNFTDLHVCTFWLDPAQSLQTYRMRTHTTRAVSDLTIWFYAATVNAQGDTTTYQLDNVSMQLAPGGSVVETRCEDPLAPPTGGTAGANLLSNHAFDTGLAPWLTFGNIQWQLSAGVFEFLKLPGTPAGVVLQSTGAAVPQNQAMLATVELGNSSNIRQRVTVIVHDANFSDLSACTFWLPPGLARQSYAMRAYVSVPWVNATLSVYPATVGASPSHQWLQLDSAGLSAISTPTAGTECFEPGSVLSLSVAPSDPPG